MKPGVISTKEVMQMLDIKCPKDFRRWIKQENSLLVPSNVQGKWERSSAYKEFRRIHGFSYTGAVEVE